MTHRIELDGQVLSEHDSFDSAATAFDRLDRDTQLRALIVKAGADRQGMLSQERGAEIKADLRKWMGLD